MAEIKKDDIKRKAEVKKAAGAKEAFQLQSLQTILQPSAL